MSIDKCCIIELPKISDVRGNLSFVQNGIGMPFLIERVYYLYDIPAGSNRGGHAHYLLEQLLIPLSGSFDVHLDDGKNKINYRLDRPNLGLYICPMIWREIDNFTSGSVCLVLASRRYEEADYMRLHSNFIDSVRKK